MSITQLEAVATLHVLVWIAKADGRLAEEERSAIEAALDAVRLSDVIGAKELFDDDFEIDDQIAVLRSPDAREHAFRSAYSLAYADGECDKDERERLARLRADLGVDAAKEHELARLFEGLAAKAHDAPSRFRHVSDPSLRGEMIREETRKCALQAAVLGAFPVPVLSLATDLAVVALQIELVRDIATMHGAALDRTAAKELLASAGMTGARLAVSTVAKLLPGWGSLVAAATAYASTYAVGNVFDRHFAKQDGLADLAREIQAAEAEGKRAYDAARTEIDDHQRRSQPELERLVDSVRGGTLSTTDLVERTRN